MKKRFKPAIDKYFLFIWIPTSILLILMTIFLSLDLTTFLIILSIDVFCYYFMVSSLVGYVELREETLFIKFGFFLKREIPYNKIRELKKERKVIDYSLLSLKNAIEHVNIKYNKFDMVTVSVVTNDELIEEILKRTNISDKTSSM